MKPTAYVINLDKRPERWEAMQRRWSPWFELVRIPGVYLPGNGAAACKMSHRMIAAHFLEQDDLITVLEDDNIPKPAFENLWPSIFDEARYYVGSWDWVNCSPWLDLSPVGGLPRANLSETASPLFLKTSYSHNTNFCLYNKRSLQLLNKSMKNPLPLDMYLGWHASDQWVPISLLAVQDDSPGDIPKPKVNAEELYALSETMLSEAVNKAKV